MGRTVMVVFSGTGIDENLFGRAAGLARAHGAGLVLLDVRHEQRADRLQTYLARESLLGRKTVERIRREVKAQRDHGIERALAELAEDARAQGLEVDVAEVKGDYVRGVRAIARERDAGWVVVDDRSAPADLAGPFEVVRV